MTDVSSQIAELLRQGKKIEAIKLLRETSGMDLKQAKEEVERLGAESGGQWASSITVIPGGPGGSTPVPSDVLELASQGKKIEAIKRLREQTGMGLKEAKEAVERATGGTKSGCMVAFLLLLVIGLGAVLAGAGVHFF